MRYYRIRWIHSHPDEPVELYSENDDAGWEKRKVEVYADGSASYADGSEQTGSSWLAEVPMPPLAEIAADPEFKPFEITKEEFEAIWQKAHQPRKIGAKRKGKPRDDASLAS